MKRVLSCIVSALVAVAFAGVVSAADQPVSGVPSDAQPPMTQSDTGTGSKVMKKAKKKKAKKTKKAKKAKKMEGTTDTGAMSQPAPAPAPAAK